MDGAHPRVPCGASRAGRVIAAFPGLAIFITTLAINLLGNALRDWLDPHMKL